MSLRAIDRELTAPGGPFEIVPRQIDGHRVLTWRETPGTLCEVLERSRTNGEETFLVYADEQITYAEHHRLVTACAQVLSRRFGVGAGDRIAIAMRNYPEWSVAFWAALRLGAIAVPLNSMGTAQELGHTLRDSGAKLVFADPERAARIAAAGQTEELLAVIVVRGDDSEKGLRFERLIEEHDGSEPPEPAVGPDSGATIFYTSGTSGQPKGVLGTHASICSRFPTAAFLRARAARRSGDQASTAGQTQRTVWLLAVPLFHVTGCHAVLLNAFAGGGKVVMMHKWDAETAADLIETEGVTHFTAVPMMVSQLVDALDGRGVVETTLRSVTYGGAPAPDSLRDRIATLLPTVGTASGYGLTEAAGMVATINGEDLAEHPGSVGLPPPVVEVEIVDEDRSRVEASKVGEVLLRTPTLFNGYWKDPETSAASLRDGWFHTGDEGRLDEDGFLYIVGRLKDVVIRAGENISCAEVERILGNHPGVRDAAVFGLPDPVFGEVVGATVQLRAGSDIEPAELTAFALERLSSYKVPRHLWTRSAPLPMGATGKTLKAPLREEAIRDLARSTN